MATGPSIDDTGLEQTPEEQKCESSGNVFFCSYPCFDSDDESTDSGLAPPPQVIRPPGVAGGVAMHDKLWDTDVLKVSFLNAVPKHWEYDGDEIDPQLIIKWASDAWKLPHIKPEERDEKDPIPQFDITAKINSADIRVMFSDDEKQGCWSLIGTSTHESKKIKFGQKQKDDHKKPTMMLNLGFVRDQSNRTIRGKAHDARIKSLVIHEFGHALGLEHEHQRSDFWEVVKGHLDLERMKNDQRVTTKGSGSGKATYGMDWFEKEFESTDMCAAYDPDSIMHYGFDVCWIKNRNLHKTRALMSQANLSDKEKRCLGGIITRSNGLAKEPSKEDIETLRKAYGKGI